jgi:hypothetical protein
MNVIHINIGEIMDIVAILKENYRYSDFYLPDERYEQHLRKLWSMPLTDEIVTYLCEQIDNPKSKRDCDLRFIHLRPLILNPTTKLFDLKQYFLNHLIKSRRPWLKLFYIMAFTVYAREEEIMPVMKQFNSILEKRHDYVDYEQILSMAGLPLLIKKYGYPCFSESLDIAKHEYMKIDPLLRGFFTLNENFDVIALIAPEECQKRLQAFLKLTNEKDV